MAKIDSKLIRSVLSLLIGMALIDALNFQDPTKVKSYIDAILKMPEVFLGVTSPAYYPSWYLAIISFYEIGCHGIFYVNYYQKVQ